MSHYEHLAGQLSRVANPFDKHSKRFEIDGCQLVITNYCARSRRWRCTVARAVIVRVNDSDATLY